MKFWWSMGVVKHLLFVVSEPSLPEPGSGLLTLNPGPTVFCSAYANMRFERIEKRGFNGSLVDFCHRLAAADKYTRTSLHDIDLVTADVAEVCLVHVGHSESY